jgi:hypothetical protein
VTTAGAKTAECSSPELGTSFAKAAIMRNVRWTLSNCALLLTASLGLAGCASEVGAGDPSSTSTENAASAVAAETHAVTTEHAGRCSPYACCFPTAGGGWQDNPFEDRLQKLGCSTPAPYEQTATTFWAWSACPFDLPLIVTVFKYSGTPYSAHFVENACLDVDPGKAAVVFDPTCPTCGPAPE